MKWKQAGVGAFALVLVALMTSACSPAQKEPGRGATADAVAAELTPSTASATATKTEPPTPRPTVETEALPNVKPYEPVGDEPTPKFKKAAARYLETLLNYGLNEGGVAAAKARLEAARLPTGPADQAKRLLKAPGPSAMQIIYPQSGGQTATAGSVMASVELYHLQGGKVVSSSRTIDIRLQVKSGNWTVIEIASDGGSAPNEADTKAGAKVLGSDKVFVTDSMRWDAQRGIMDQRVFRSIEDFSNRHELKLTVFKTGHPYYVFGKKAVSYHSRGRAFDIWMIDGVTVAEWGKRPATNNPARELMARALELGSNEVGGPWAFSTSRGRTFTNLTHLDHLHIGFKST